jgi:hypothetical protein
MPFAGPETALSATIEPGAEGNFVPGKTARPAACKDPSAIYQSLPPILNNLKKEDCSRTNAVQRESPVSPAIPYSDSC